MIAFKVSGSFRKSKKFLSRSNRKKIHGILAVYASIGVGILESATPKDSGITAGSWGYYIEDLKDGYAINWTNSNVNDGVPIAVILRYGHGTGNGGYVAGREYISPAIRPLFDNITNAVWKEVCK